MPESLKFFLFGVSKRRRRSRKDSSEIIEEFPVIESGNHSLAESIEKWASIESNILRDFSMQSIAIGLGLDVSEIKDYFNNVSTEGFYKWRNRARIILASKLITRYPEDSLESIGRKVGFPDKSNFYKQFRMYTGKTPGEWRNARSQNFDE